MTEQELFDKIQSIRNYLGARRISRQDNFQVIRVATFNKGLYILYKYADGRPGYVVKAAVGEAFRASSKADAKQVIIMQEKLYGLLRAAEINSWQNDTFDVASSLQ